MRYFGQTPDYWLDTCTIDEWTRIWARELNETPPVDVWAGTYFKHEPQTQGAQDDDPEDAGEWECPFPEKTE